MLDGLGFAPTDLERSVAEFSGGWRMRLNLARALMCPSDLLLLDEPTNHLDLDAIVWLEGWLRGYQGTLALVSHDREFLDAVVSTIVSFENRGLRRYTGNYSAFEARAPSGSRTSRRSTRASSARSRASSRSSTASARRRPRRGRRRAG